jgi:hypothetical protein
MFTVQLFARYLVFLARGASIIGNVKLQNVLVKQFTFDLMNTPTLLSNDFLLFHILVRNLSRIDRNSNGIKTNSASSKFSVSELRRLLVLISVEQLTVFHELYHMTIIQSVEL